MLAARQGNEKVIKALINKGMDVNAKSSAGITPLLMAIASNQKSAVKILIDSGARVSDKDKLGRGAIFYSTQKITDPEIVKMLLEKGANINETDNSGFTPLSLAAANGNMPVVKLLVASGLSANGAGSDGDFKPLMAASANNQAAIVKQLLTYKPDIDARDKHGKTALMWAAEYNCQKCVETLLVSGASIELVDKKNNSAFDFAKKNPKAKEIIKLLGAQLDPRNPQ